MRKGNLPLSSFFPGQCHIHNVFRRLQGFATGDCDRDSQAIRTFLDDGHSLGCSQSYAKNMGLYGQRIGCLSLVCADKAEASAVESQVKVWAQLTFAAGLSAGTFILHLHGQPLAWT